MNISQLNEELKERFLQEHYIKLNTQLNDEGNLLIFLAEPSEENYVNYTNIINKYLEDEMLGDYILDGDYEGIIEIYS